MSAPGSGDWEPGTAATITIVDPDLNTNPGSAETLSIGNSSSVIPTIIMGSPLTLAGGGQSNPDLQAGDGNVGTGVITGVAVGDDDQCNCGYSLNIQNTSDNSERLRIIHFAKNWRYWWFNTRNNLD